MKPVITAFNWVPPFAEGQVRDLRVRWALEEVGQPYDVRYLSQGAHKGAEHRALQPFGQVPTYEEDDLVLFESGAIVFHIAEKSGDGLLPSDPAARSRAVEWMFAALNSVEPPIMDHAIATIFEADQPWSKARLPSVNARIDERLGELSRRLGDRDWLDGAFTAGDLLMVAVVRTLEGDALLDPYPNLIAYVARGTARPAFQRALAAQMAGFTGEPPARFKEWAEKQKQAQGETA